MTEAELMANDIVIAREYCAAIRAVAILAKDLQSIKTNGELTNDSARMNQLEVDRVYRPISDGAHVRKETYTQMYTNLLKQLKKDLENV